MSHEIPAEWFKKRTLKKTVQYFKSPQNLDSFPGRQYSDLSHPCRRDYFPEPGRMIQKRTLKKTVQYFKSPQNLDSFPGRQYSDLSHPCRRDQFPEPGRMKFLTQYLGFLKFTSILDRGFGIKIKKARGRDNYQYFRPGIESRDGSKKRSGAGFQAGTRTDFFKNSPVPGFSRDGSKKRSGLGFMDWSY